MVALRRTLPAPSMTVAARTRTVGSCADSPAAASSGANRRALNRMAHYNPVTRSMLKPMTALIVAAMAAALAPAPPEVDWPFYGGDPAGTKYSPLADIT